MTNSVLHGYRLSPQQARAWALGRAAPGHALGVACALRLRGPLDAGALRRALAHVAVRHEILRTAFHAPAEGGPPMQVVGDEADVPLDPRDVAGLPEGERAAVEAAAWRSATRRDSPADGGPPLRAVLLRRAEGDHVLHLSLSALCADAATLDALVAETGAAYAARSGEGAGTTDEEPFQYVDFSEGLHETREGGGSHEGRSFWARQRLPDESPLPALWPVPAAAAGTAAAHRTLGAELARRMDDAAAAHGTDAEAWLLAAWRVLLQRHAGEDDDGFTVGAASDGRGSDEMRGALGPFTRYLPVRGDVDGAEPFAALAAATGDGLRQARAWQEFHAWPADGEDGPRHLPFGFDWAEPAPQAGRWGGVEWKVERRWHQTERFGVRLSAERLRECGDAGLRLSLVHDTAALHPDGAARLLRRLAVLLEATLAHPAARADALGLLDAEERAEALGMGAGGPASFPADEPLHRRFERQAARAPDAVAVSSEGESLTYGELDARANRLARHLRARGVRPEARVGLCMERGMDAVVGILGILKAGGAYVPLDPAYPAERLAYVLEDAGIRVLLTHAAVRGRIPLTAAEVVCVDGAADAIAGKADATLPGAAGADSLAYVIYTSGSTGRPKGVQVTHAGVSRLFASTEASFAFGADDVWTLFHSLAFDFSVWELWGALLYGGRLVVVPFGVSRAPADFRTLLAREGVTVLSQTPSAFRQLIAADAAADSPLALRWVVFGGEALEPGTLRPWMDRHGDECPQLVNMYGITETTVHVTHRRITRADVERGARSPVGVPLADLAVYVLDGHLQPVPPGIAGEMFVGGAGVARGYLGRPGLTAERFVPDPFSAGPGARMYRSGDRARRLPGGELEFLGRADAQVKIRGFRIEPGEIEAALLRHPAVADAAVVAREDVPGDRRLVAYVVAAHGAETHVAGLRTHLGAALPEYMVPAAFVALPRLPLTPNGKLDRRALPAPAPAEGEDGAYVAPRTATEEVLAALWSEVLGVERVGIDDSFFALGGDSILSVRVAARARERGLPLDIADLFARPTIRLLAERVAEGGWEATALDAILRRDRRPFDLVAEEDRGRLPADAEDAYPLSGMQAGMLYHLALTPDAPAYHNVDSYHFRGAFDEAAFRAALRRATARQDNLRTSVHLSGFGEPLQVVHREAAIPLAVADIRHLDEAAQEALLAELAEREWRTPFDLARAPLMRLHVHLRGDDRFHLTLAENHAINDGWSLTSLFADLFADQAALLRGEPLPERPEPALRFRDFIEMERATLASAETRAFWAERLAGVEPARLPRLPGAGPAGQGTGFVDVPLAPEVRERLGGLARTLGVPLKSVLLAAHVKALGLATGQQDVVTGLVTNGRPEVEGGTDMRGLFLNTVPFRLDLAPESWADLVRRVFRAETELLPHRRYPLAALQREHGSERLFETAFNLVRFHALADVLRAGTVEVLSGADVADNGYTACATAKLHPVTAEIVGFGLDYEAGEISRGQAEALADRYRRVLAAMVADPAARHDRLAAVSAEERALVVEAWNATAAPYPAGLCIHQLFEEQAARTPHAPAVLYGDDVWTYAELDARGNQLAHQLRRLGVGPEVRVGLCLERGMEMMAGILGVLKAGGAYVPVDPGHPAERVAYVLRDSAVSVMLVQERLRDRVPADLDARLVSVDCGPRVAADRHAPPASAVASENLAYVIYTSGSTGRPKGVAMHHRGVVNYIHWGIRHYGADAGNGAPVFSSMAVDLTITNLLPLFCGHPVRFLPEENPVEALAETIRTRPGYGLIKITPTHLSLLTPLLTPDEARGAARTLVIGADFLPAEPTVWWQENAPDVRLMNEYGPTETVVGCSAYTLPTGVHRNGPVPVGGPIQNLTFFVLDGRMEPVPAGTPGELYIGGAGVARGYLGRPALSAEKFVPDPFAGGGARMYRTGDRAQWLGGGNLMILGRTDSQVKIRGYRVELGEIESALRRHEAVDGCMVVVREDVPGDRRLVAYVVSDAEPAELRAFLRRGLPEYMVPGAFVRLETLPNTATGKVDPRTLPAPEYGSPAERYVAPRTPLEERLAEIWAEVLGVERVGVHDSFFELGGHSLLVMQLIARVWESFDVALQVRGVFAAPTLETMAVEVERLVIEDVLALTGAEDGELVAADAAGEG